MIKIGTRGSRLALAQADIVQNMLKSYDIESEIKIIRTKGDAVTDRGLHKIGGYGVFVRELDDALISGEIDAAVHSMKDIPAQRPSALTLAAVLKRDSPYDFMASHKNFDDISVIGTSSLRRCAQLRRYYQKLGKKVEIKQLRGNIDTRLSKLKAGDYDGIVLAEAGFERMKYDKIGFRLPYNEFVPGPNQGTIAVVCRSSEEIIKIFRQLNDEASAFDTMIERKIMEVIEGGCFTPQGIFCKDGHVIAEILSLDGSMTERIEEDVSSLNDAAEIGRRLKCEAAVLIAEAKSICAGGS